MRMWKTFVAVAVGGGLLSAGSPLLAQEAKRPTMKCEQLFTQLDTNKDGKITPKEFKAVPHAQGNPEEIFKARDTNKDGALSKEEFCAKGPGTGKGRGSGQGSGQGQAK